MGNLNAKLTPKAKELLNKLAGMKNIDLSPVMGRIADGYNKEVKAIFEKKQPRQTGLRWKPLSEKYAKWKAVHYPGKPLLVRTGDLKESMTTRGAKGNIREITRKSAILGSSIPYGIYHDSNKTRTSNLPRRNFSEPSEDRERIWLNQIIDDLIRQFSANGIIVKKDVFQ